ncbi:MAG TPA: MFS transporter [Nocardioidaceae bacterium]|nr:MFS transporter [Nocardioidaceae bacterium]
MTSEQVRAHDVPVWRLPGMRPLVLLTAAGFGGFAALLPVAPLWVARGGAGEAGAGLVTGVLLLLTILTQPFVPWLLNRFGHGAVLAVGLVALGLPAPLYGLSDQLAPVLAISAVRGVGFGILTVTGSAVVAELVPLARRGEAVGVYGLGVAVPNLVILPGSVALAQSAGFGWAFALGALSLLGIPAALRLGVVLRRRVEAEPQHGPVRRAPIPLSVLARVTLPAVVLFVVTLSGGGIMTFLPQAVASPALASWGLLVVGAVAAVSRWWIGRIGDRRGADRLMAPLLALTAGGLVLTAVGVAADGWVVLLLAMAVVGFGYGALQNVTLVCAFAQVTPRHYGSASAVWNIGFDAGTGLGAVMLGLIAAAADFPTGFVVSAVVVAACIPLSLRLGSRRQWAGDAA